MHGPYNIPDQIRGKVRQATSHTSISSYLSCRITGLSEIQNHHSPSFAQFTNQYINSPDLLFFPYNLKSFQLLHRKSSIYIYILGFYFYLQYNPRFRSIKSATTIERQTSTSGSLPVIENRFLALTTPTFI